MASPRPFRFGAKATKAGSAKEWADIARQAEDLGYVSLQIDDHFGNQLAPIPAIMAAAAVTTNLKVGTLVAGVDFRNPVVLAKEAATIDLLSEGRFMLGTRRRVAEGRLRHRRHRPGRRRHPHRPARRGRRHHAGPVGRGEVLLRG